jgi:hypothetical protein
MKTDTQTWFSIGQPNGTVLRCAACGGEFDFGGPTADHHPRWCSSCGVECALLNWKDRVVQIVPSAAPAKIAEVLRWLQTNFDELEYVELLVALEELVDALPGTAKPDAAPDRRGR